MPSFSTARCCEWSWAGSVAPWMSWFHSSKRPVQTNPGLPAFIAALALAHAEGNRIDEARRLLEEFVVADFELPLDQLWLTGIHLVHRGRHRMPR